MKPLLSLLGQRAARKITHDQVMADLWAYADRLEVEALLQRLNVRWSE